MKVTGAIGNCDRCFRPFQLIKCAALAFPRGGNAHQSLGEPKIYLIGRHILFSPRSLSTRAGISWSGLAAPLWALPSLTNFGIAQPLSTGICYADGNVKDERSLVVEQAIAGLL